ncbi:pancreatic alpha-amylase [Striga asiatica]|uniref:Pancreatic alpha-amylase n=1 Tax=Striga asiatica TaxID=4170 RepID=A0A5A7QQN8_STRAF|nr:pancreatic alpha-amylase [Striga asiatica]
MKTRSDPVDPVYSIHELTESPLLSSMPASPRSRAWAETIEPRSRPTWLPLMSSKATVELHGDDAAAGAGGGVGDAEESTCGADVVGVRRDDEGQAAAGGGGGVRAGDGESEEGGEVRREEDSRMQELDGVGVEDAPDGGVRDDGRARDLHAASVGHAGGAELETPSVPRSNSVSAEAPPERIEIRTERTEMKETPSESDVMVDQLGTGGSQPIGKRFEGVFDSERNWKGDGEKWE